MKYIDSETARKQIAGSMSEQELRDKHVIPMAKSLGWTVYFTWNSYHSPSGLVDLIIFRRGKILWRELKSERGKLTSSQEECIRGLHMANQDVKVWRPRDWFSGAIENELKP